MSDEHITSIWKYAISGVLVFIMLLVGSCQATNYHIRKAVEAGAPPISAKCAFSDFANHQQCAVLAAAEADAIKGPGRR